MKKCPKCNYEAADEVKYCPDCGTSYLDYPKPAGFWIRLVASLIDALVFIPLIIISFINFLSIKSFLLYLILAIPGLIYKPFMESHYGATLGKMALGLKVIDENGNKLDLKAAYLRFIFFMISSIITIAGGYFVFSSPEFQDASGLIEVGRAKRHVYNGPLNILKSIANIVVFIDCLFVAFSFRKRALHDMMAKSFCIYKKS